MSERRPGELPQGSASPGDATRHRFSVPLVHAVTTDAIAGAPGFLDRARGVMAALGARGALHLRAPQMPALALYRLATALGEAQQRTGCWLVVVDRVDVALAAGARGVQLTSRSVRVADARRIAPDLAAGASVHTLAEAERAAEAGADWVVVSELRDVPGAADVDSALGALQDAARAVSAPLLVIGRMLPEHLPFLRRAGVHGVAVIRGIWETENAERAATEYLSAHDAQGAA